jgi:hypothetical protein
MREDRKRGYRGAIEPWSKTIASQNDRRGAEVQENSEAKSPQWRTTSVSSMVVAEGC